MTVFASRLLRSCVLGLPVFSSSSGSSSVVGLFVFFFPIVFFNSVLAVLSVALVLYPLVLVSSSTAAGSEDTTAICYGGSIGAPLFSSSWSGASSAF